MFLDIYTLDLLIADNKNFNFKIGVIENHELEFRKRGTPKI